MKCVEIFISLCCIFFGLRTWKDGLAIGGKTRGCPGLGEKAQEFTFRHLKFEIDF